MTDTIASTIGMSENFTLITVNTLTNDDRIISKILNELYGCNINVDLISFAHLPGKDVNFSFTVDTSLFSRTIAVMGRFKGELPGFFCNVRTNCAKITIPHDDEFKTDKNAKVIKAIADCGVKLHLFSSSLDCIEIIVGEDDAGAVLKKLKQIYTKGNG